jgi:hypothetical protein
MSRSPVRTAAVVPLTSALEPLMFTPASAPNSLPSVKDPLIVLTLTNWLDPKAVLVKRSVPPLTTALTPVACVSWLTAKLTALVAVLAAKLSCSVPALPATSIVTALVPTVAPLKSTSASFALAVTSTVIVL